MSKEEDQKQILKETLIEDEYSAESLTAKIKLQQKKKKKKKTIRIIILCVLAFFTVIFKWLMNPYKASAEYGICRSFLELFVPYPHTIYVSEIKMQRDGSLKLWYTHNDAFGEYRIEDFQCKVLPNPKTGLLEVLDIKMHKVTLEPEKVKSLNSAMVYFVENPLILDWPAPLPDSLNDLLFEFDRFRKIIIAQKR